MLRVVVMKPVIDGRVLKNERIRALGPEPKFLSRSRDGGEIFLSEPVERSFFVFC